MAQNESEIRYLTPPTVDVKKKKSYIAPINMIPKSKGIYSHKQYFPMIHRQK